MGTWIFANIFIHTHKHNRKKHQRTHTITHRSKTHTQHPQEAVSHCHKYWTFWCWAQKQQQTNGGNKQLFSQHKSQTIYCHYTHTHTHFPKKAYSPKVYLMITHFLASSKMTDSWELVVFFFFSHFTQMRNQRFLETCFSILRDLWPEIPQKSVVAYYIALFEFESFKRKRCCTTFNSPWCCVI